MKEKSASPLEFRPSAPSEEASPASPASPPSVQASKASLVYPSKDDELYDPFSLRPSGVQYSDFGAWAHMVKGGMGTGIMSMPMAFKYGGLVLGLLGTPLVGLLSGHCVLMLVSTAQHLYVRARVPAMTMDQVAYYAFKCGPKRMRPYASAARSFVWAALFTTYFCVLISYSIFIGAAIQQLVEQWTGQEVINTRVYIGLLAIPLVPLGQVRQLRTLVPCSVTANLCVVVGFAITIYYLVDRAPDMDNVSLSPSLIGVPIFFSTALYSMEGIGSVMPVENTMRNPGRLGGWNGVAARAIVFIVMLFTVIGLLGYLRFGPAVMGSITLNLDQALVPAQVVKALLVIAITFTHPLQFYVLCELFEPMLEKRISSATLLSLAKSGMRVALVALSLLIAVAVPNLELAIALIGAVLFSTVGLLIPAGVHLVSELGLIADGEPGRWRALTVAKDAVIITLSLLVACAGVYSALADQDQGGDGRKA